MSYLTQSLDMSIFRELHELSSFGDDFSHLAATRRLAPVTVPAPSVSLFCAEDLQSTHYGPHLRLLDDNYDLCNNI